MSGVWFTVLTTQHIFDSYYSLYYVLCVHVMEVGVKSSARAIFKSFISSFICQGQRS